MINHYFFVSAKRPRFADANINNIITILLLSIIILSSAPHALHRQSSSHITIIAIAITTAATATIKILTDRGP